MKNEDVIAAFVRREKAGKTRNLCVGAIGRDLINYGTVIARWIDTGDAASPAALFVSSTRYSDSTSVLQNLTEALARKAGIPTFRVPKLGGEDWHTVNLFAFDAQALDFLNKLRKGRVTSADSYRRQASDAIAQGDAYAELFNVVRSHDVPEPETVRHPSEEA